MIFETKNLDVGYNKKILIHNINIQLEKGQITTLIGPNGSGKSTILKTISNHLDKIAGTVYIERNDMNVMSNKRISEKLSVVLTERISTEYMTCEEVVGLGRYPYTNSFGTLTEQDRAIVKDSLEKVNAWELKDRAFHTLSDGQHQRILLARAICQQPEILVLDEPTSFLDIHHKIELLEILQKMVKDKKIAVIMSLHEIDLAPKISDMVICVKGNRIMQYGPPEQIFNEDIIEELYDLERGRYNMLFGSIELSCNEGKPEIFIVSGNGCGIPIYRVLQKKGIPFRTGILFENDVDYQVATALGSEVFVEQAFHPISDKLYKQAYEGLKKSKFVVDAGTQRGEFNNVNGKLLEEARKLNIPVYNNIQSLLNAVQCE